MAERLCELGTFKGVAVYCLVLTQSTCVTDGRTDTDRQRDRITTPKTMLA